MTSKDWAQDGKDMVKEGSDGVWLRVGPQPDDTKLKSRFFAIQCNPIVSIGATVILFGWVIFCMAWLPGKYCLAPGTEVLNVSSTSNVFSGLPTDVVKNTVMLGSNSYMHEIERATVVEADCYVPRKEFSYWMSWVTYTSTWLYISTQDVWIVFVFVIIFSKYGKLKMGPDDEPPEFSNIEWFSMIFCCGVATGLFYFSVGEPINHYEGCPGGSSWSGPNPNDWGDIPCKWGNRYSHLPDNERAQRAMTLTFYHWGLHGWVCYAVVGALLGILHFRKGLPMTMKSCFYPLIGTRVYSCWGDAIDVLSIVCTTFGVCTSLGMGVQQINAGLTMLNGGKNWMGQPYYGELNKADWFADWETSAKGTYDAQSEAWRKSNPWGVAAAGQIAQRSTEVSQQILLIWIITIISTGSICTGLSVGVKWLSIIALVLGLFLLWVIVALDDTWFIMNLFVQTLGQYVQYITEIGFYTGAFDQPEHAAPDGKMEYSSWMNDWTIFYWGWWISWAPFVGVFLARISKGRTVREFFVVCIIITVAYNFVWMTVWGGAALKMEMAAEKAGIGCSADGLWTKNYCRQDTGVPGKSFGRFTSEPLYFCSSVTRLSCHKWNYPPMMFDLVNQYQNLGTFLSVLVIIALFLYFITSSDSGSLVDTIVSANGLEEPVIAQRVWWSLTEGLSATGLLYSSLFDIADPKGAMKALQAASIAAGLPYTFLVCLVCLALWKALKYEFNEENYEEGFKSSVLDVGITLYKGKADKPRGCACQGPSVRKAHLKEVVQHLFCPFLGMKKALLLHEEKKKGESAKKSGPWLNFVAISVGVVMFYGAWLFLMLDAIPITPGGYLEFGVSNSSSTGLYNIVPRYVSNRYGHFRHFTNKWAAGEAITAGVNERQQYQEDMAMGDRVGSAMHFAVFGWFFFFMFVATLTAMRTSLRETLKIKGNAAEDFLCCMFAWPTVILQMREVLEEGPAQADNKSL